MVGAHGGDRKGRTLALALAHTLVLPPALNLTLALDLISTLTLSRFWAVTETGRLCGLESDSQGRIGPDAWWRFWDTQIREQGRERAGLLAEALWRNAIWLQANRVRVRSGSRR